jgi:hypothetical protein
MPALPHVIFCASQSLLSGIRNQEGEAFALLLATACRAAGFTCDPPELWRDLGWEFKATQGDDEYAIRFAQRGQHYVLLTVVPWDVAGLFARYVSAKRTPTFQTHRKLCVAIHARLLEDSSLSQVSWLLGGPPEKVPRYRSPGDVPFRDGF